MNTPFMGKDGFVWWVGVVEDNTDPLKLGRCRVRVLGFHSEFKTDIPTEDLPWAVPMQPITSASISGIGRSPTGILHGTWVVGFFRDGSDAQEPIIMGTLNGINLIKPDSGLGFSDPDGVYPKLDHLEEPDTNRLARNENLEKTIVALKKINLKKDITTALDNETWEEPESPYNAVYPKNHVTETESGHIQEFDDTPNAERIHTYHKSGTFEEIHPDGTKVQKIVKDNYEIILENTRIYVKGKKSENIEETCNLRVGGDLNIQVEGDANILVNGNSTMETKGDHLHKVKGSYGVISEGNMVFLAPRIDLNPNGTNSSDIGDIF